MHKLYELQKVLNLEEIKDFNDFKKYYKNKNPSIDKTLLENILIKKVNDEEVLDFNDFKKNYVDDYYCHLLLFLNTVLNLKENDCFESLKEFFNGEYSEIEKRIFESFCINYLDNIDFEFDSNGNLIMKEKDEIETIINIDACLNKGLKISGINNEFYDGFNKEYINCKLINELKKYFYYELTYIYNIEELEKRDSKVIAIFENYIKEKFCPTQKEIKKYILKYRK